MAELVILIIISIILGEYQWAYSSMLKAIGVELGKPGCIITPDMYKSHMFLVAYDLSVDGSASQYECAQLVANGSIRIEGKFKNPLTQTLNAIILTTHPTQVTVNKARNIFVTE